MAKADKSSKTSKKATKGKAEDKVKKSKKGAKAKESKKLTRAEKKAAAAALKSAEKKVSKRGKKAAESSDEEGNAPKLRKSGSKGSYRVTVVASGVRLLKGKVVSSEDGLLKIEHTTEEGKLHTMVPQSEVVMKSPDGVLVTGNHIIGEFYASSVAQSADDGLMKLVLVSGEKVVVNTKNASVTVDQVVGKNKDEDDEEEEAPKKGKGKKKSKDDDEEEWDLE